MAVPTSGSVTVFGIAGERAYDTYALDGDYPNDGIGASQKAAIRPSSMRDLFTSGNTYGGSYSYPAKNTVWKTSTGSVTTTAAASITGSGAILKATLNNYGGSPQASFGSQPYKISQMREGYDDNASTPSAGFVWSRYNTTPTIGGSNTTQVVSGTENGSGIFANAAPINYNYTLTGQNSNVTIYYRGYVSNNVGTVYGSVSSFTTDSGLNGYSLKYDASKFGEAGICSNSNTTTVYSSESNTNNIFVNRTQIYSNSGGSTDASTGWYSNGFYYNKYQGSGNWFYTSTQGC